VHPSDGGPPKGDFEKTESATVDFTNAKAESLQVLFRPEGASTNQPRAERSGDRRPGAALPLVALPQAVLWRPFRAEESPGAIFESWTLCVAVPRA
jgi:hypothetical protein